MEKQRIIVSSLALYKYLVDKMEFWKEEVKVKVFDHELQIDGFRWLCVEHQSEFETTVSVDKLRQLRRFLATINDQPITIHIGQDSFTIHYVSI